MQLVYSFNSNKVSRATLLEKVCEYLHYNYRYKNQLDIPKFDIPPEMVLELLVTAEYLEGKIIITI